MSGAVAEKMVTKANLLPKFDFQGEQDSGVDLPTAIQRSSFRTESHRSRTHQHQRPVKPIMLAMSKVQRHFGGIKSFENMRDALREMSNMARKVSKQAKMPRKAHCLRYEENPGKILYFNGDST
jgi:hypothetical protein